MVPTTSLRLRESLRGIVRSERLLGRHIQWFMVRLGAGSAGTEGKREKFLISMCTREGKDNIKLDLQSAESSQNLSYTKSSARDAIRIL